MVAYGDEVRDEAFKEKLSQISIKELIPGGHVKIVDSAFIGMSNCFHRSVKS